MPNYRRSYDGNTWFFTLVTGQRRAILYDDRLRPLLRQTLRTAKERWPFRIDARVLLPDHLHCIWTLPEEDADFSKRWGWIKKEFGKQARSVVGTAHPSGSRQQKRETGIWQRRFWEHRIRSEADYAAHCDYIHFNPVKHGLVATPSQWPYSTFHRCVEQGSYPMNWGESEPNIPKAAGNE